MSRFIVIKLMLDNSMFFGSAHSINQVEIRPSSSDTESERAALEISLGINKEQCNLNRVMRTVVVVDAESLDEAIYIADLRVDEALDILELENSGISVHAIMKSGCVRNLLTGGIDPIVYKTFGPFPTYRIDQYLGPLLPSQYLATLAESELKTGLLRSLHWTRLACNENNPQLEFVFRWFALEALLKIGINDSIEPRVRWVLGFPNGGGTNLIQDYLLESIHSHPDYKRARGLIIRRLDGMRDLRNNIVHNGFRFYDHIDKSILSKYVDTATWATARVQKIAVTGLYNGLATVEKICEYLPILVTERSNYINDLHGTVISLLIHSGNT